MDFVEQRRCENMANEIAKQMFLNEAIFKAL